MANDGAILKIQTWYFLESGGFDGKTDKTYWDFGPQGI